MKSKPERKPILLHLPLIVLLLTALAFVFIFQTCLDAQETTRRGNRRRQGTRAAAPVPPPASPLVTPQVKKTSAVDLMISLEIGGPTDMSNAVNDGTEAVPGKQLDLLIEAGFMAARSPRGTFLKPLNLKTRGKVAQSLLAASEIETDECHKQYLKKLSGNILDKGSFTVELPQWINLDENRYEIVFRSDERYRAGLMLLSPYIDIIPFWDKGIGVPVVYINDPESTRKVKEYVDIFAKMQFNLPAAFGAQKEEIVFTSIPPSFKISRLVFTPDPDGFSLVYPELVFEGEQGTGEPGFARQNRFKIIIFENLVEAYFEGVIKPVAAFALTGERMLEVDYDSYLSNLVMNRISHHLGPVFVLRIKGEEEQTVPPWLQSQQRQQKKQKKTKIEKELRPIRDVLGDLFPVMEAVKSRAVALHNTEVLIKNGLLPEDKESSIYSTFLATLIDDLRIRPASMMPPQLGKPRPPEVPGDPDVIRYKAALIHFNYLLENEAVKFSITDQALDIDRLKFKEAETKLTKDILNHLKSSVYFSVNGFIQKNVQWPPLLDEIMRKLEDMPTAVEFRLETGKNKEKVMMNAE
jgi:hypothetical protein